MVGVVEDLSALVGHAFRRPGDAVVQLGTNRGELGGSEYLYWVHGVTAGEPPAVELEVERALQRCLLALARRRLLASAHDVSCGGLAAALAECCLGRPRRGPGLGAAVRFDDELTDTALLFGEDHGRVVASCRPGNADAVLSIAAEHGVPARRIGVVGDKGSSPRSLDPLFAPPPFAGGPRRPLARLLAEHHGRAAARRVGPRERPKGGVRDRRRQRRRKRRRTGFSRALRAPAPGAGGRRDMRRAETGGPRLHKELGLVSDVFDADRIASLAGPTAVGHVRYSTAGSGRRANAQPIVVRYSEGDLAIVHNGNLTNARFLKRRLVADGAIFQSSSDSEVVVHLIARSRHPSVEAQLRDALNFLEGAYSLVVTVGDDMYAVRDPRGFRPLVTGTLPGGGHVVASETCALDIMGAEFARDVEPGELLRFRNGRVEQLPGLHRKAAAPCVFELVYFARPDSTFGA